MKYSASEQVLTVQNKTVGQGGGVTEKMQDYETQYIDYDTDINYSMTIFIDIQFCSIKSITFEKKNIKYPFIIYKYLMFNTDIFQLRIYLNQL